ncbi:MAG: nucleotidyl transferase AbiEii/AbiGii toxin family protein [Bacteroidetes bacterium]|nr:nucleotidyl transferase AbiEii/AbiGii toxin family protein [Bacteroidota bacterium]
MLYLSTIDSKTLGLLKTLMLIEEFSNMRLVGGTALALQIGHRKSIDLDLFGEVNFENLDKITTFKNFGKVTVLSTSKNINIYSIDKVKVDFVNYSYPWLKDQKLIDGIRLADIDDIAAMKLAAITGRGSRKDFIDIYFLLQEYSLRELLGFYKKKYFDASEYLVLKSLTYFDDAEDDLDVNMIEKISWCKIKEYILKSVEKTSV